MSVTTAGTAAKSWASRKEILGWAMFDFANQAYTLLIITVVFGELFTTVIVGERGGDFRLANFLWSLALSISYLLVVISGPLCGAVMDYRADKKRFLFASYLATIGATAMLYFVAPGYVVLGLVLIVISNYAYSMGESFIAAFLPDLGPPEALGRISGFGWSLGYVGGLFAAGFTLLVLGETSAANFERIRWVGPFAAVFFLVAALPTFLWLRERGTPQPPGLAYHRIAWQRVSTTLQELRRFRDLGLFLVSLLFSMAGVYIIIAFAFIYGAQVIGWDAAIRNIMFIIVQITAAAGALGFGAIQDRIGTRRTYLITLGLWVAAILAIWATPELTGWLNAHLGLGWEAQHLFLVVGCLAGLSLGSSQSASRALVGLFSPRRKAAEFFGFWGLANKLAGVVGIIGLGLLQSVVGLQASILLCAVLFIIAILICLGVSQTRGMQAAREWEARNGEYASGGDVARCHSASNVVWRSVPWQTGRRDRGGRVGSERREVRRFGLGMMLLFWVLLMGLGSWWLQDVLERRENPNAHLVNVNAGETLTLERNAAGHFVATGRINGEPVPFLLDTGATYVAVSDALAERIGLERHGQAWFSTANGRARGYLTTLDTVSLGGLRARAVRGSISSGLVGDKALLGMSYLGRFDISISGDQMTLKAPAGAAP